MTIVYSVPGYNDDGCNFFASMADAIKAAQTVADYSGEPAIVQACEVAQMPRRHLLAALLNRRGWCPRAATVRTITPKKGA